jgi:hypothetical protein
MPAPNNANFDHDKMIYGTTTTPRQSGGKFLKVGYGTIETQVHFQVGESAYDTSRVPYGAEWAARDDPASGRVMKVEVTPEKKEFIKALEATTVQAVSKNSQEFSNAVHNSRLSPQNGDRPDVLKVKISDGSAGPETTVEVSKRQGGGRLTNPVPGTVADITPGCYVLPLIRVQGGVYFINRTYSQLCPSILLCVWT